LRVTAATRSPSASIRTCTVTVSPTDGDSSSANSQTISKVSPVGSTALVDGGNRHDDAQFVVAPHRVGRGDVDPDRAEDADVVAGSRWRCRSGRRHQ